MYRSMLIIGCLVQPMLAAEPIKSVTAKATSSQVAKLFGPENLVTDVGLSEPDKQGARTLTTNGYTGGGCMWHSAYIALGGDENATVEFDLAKVYHVGKFHVWNNNGSPTRGFRHVSVMISTDGKTWKGIAQRFEFAKATQKDDYTGESYEFTPAITARYIRFHCDSTHRMGGNRELAGLGKVRFYEATAAPPKESPDLYDGIFPADAGVINLRAAPYFAKGDGVTDDSALIQKAIDDWQASHRILYLPIGTYLISKPLAYRPGKGFGYNNLRGYGAGKTIIRLKDQTFTDATQPQAVLSLGFNGKADGKGVHADWFNCNVSDLTIDCGQRNPGAIGLRFYSNNVGALRDVTIRSEDHVGVVGLDLGYADQNGPCLIKNVSIDGFATGVATGATVNSQTAEHITITHCSKVGWHNKGQCLSIRGLKVSGTGTGFISDFGIVALIDSEFTGKGDAAIITRETLFARNIKTTGYPVAILNRREKDGPTPNAIGPNVTEWVSTGVLTLFPHEKPTALNLPIEETPALKTEDSRQWVNIRAFRELNDPDDSASLQRAIDSGSKTIYLPSGGQYFFSKAVTIHGQTERIVGLFSGIHHVGGKGKWIIKPEGITTVFIQDCKGQMVIDHAANKTLVVSNGQGMDGVLSGGGKLFLENVVADWEFKKGSAWCRQMNNEREGVHLSNQGANLWILGYKTERGGQLVETLKGASTEIIGGLSYTTTKGKLAPMFTVQDGNLSVVMGEVCYTGDPYATIVEEKRGNETKTLLRNQVPLRPNFLQGSQIPLFVSRQP